MDKITNYIIPGILLSIIIVLLYSYPTKTKEYVAGYIDGFVEGSNTQRERLGVYPLIELTQEEKNEIIDIIIEDYKSE